MEREAFARGICALSGLSPQSYLHLEGCGFGVLLVLMVMHAATAEDPAEDTPPPRDFSGSGGFSSFDTRHVFLTVVHHKER